MPDTLNPGQHLAPGQQITSANGRLGLVMQADRNLVLYQFTPRGAYPLWATGTNGPDAWKAEMQKEGNLVVYAAGGKALWNSATGVAGSRLVAQDDGNLVIYAPDGAAVWDSKTDYRFSADGAILHAHGQTYFGNARTAEASAVLNRNTGTLTITTRVWSRSWLQGITAGSGALLTAAGTGQATVTNIVAYGVDGLHTPFGAPSDRTDVRVEQVDRAFAENVTEMRVLVVHAPHNRIVEIIGQGGVIASSITKALEEFCKKNPKICDLIKRTLPQDI